MDLSPGLSADASTQVEVALVARALTVRTEALTGSHEVALPRVEPLQVWSPGFGWGPPSHHW